ncbi:MAG: ArsC family transcriptional regulator [Clostridia bacterium]|nr:ArsC family transcriptional regulator [Clostridia bacterium]
MNIQIFGTKKSADTRKAERWFKERGIRFQSIDMRDKGLSRGEFDAVLRAVGSLDALLDEDCRDRELLSLVEYLGERDRADKAFENQEVLRLPVVRNGKQATVGYAPDVWKTWE